jgi:KAP family P-loop domain
MSSKELVIQYSASVNSVFSRFPHPKKASALDILRALQKIHPEYAADKMGEIDFEGKGHIAFTIEEWKEKIASLLNSNREQHITGKVLLLALSVIDEGEQLPSLFSEHFVQNLELELKDGSKAPADILTTEAFEIWNQIKKLVPTASQQQNTTQIPPPEKKLQYQSSLRNHSDHPSQIDLLSRDSLAEVLAERIRALHVGEAQENITSNAFFVHIDGPWGSGKSTFLNFLKFHLQKDQPDLGRVPWAVVEFNAWANQRLDPPWWPFLQQVFKGLSQFHWNEFQFRRFGIKGIEHLYYWGVLGIRHFIFRHIIGSNRWISFVVLPLFIFVLLNWGLSGLDALDGMKKYADLLSALGGIITALATGIYYGGSAQGAVKFMEASKDPMSKVSHHFLKLVKSAHHPVAIFIDDLDRCSIDFGVELMEGIQTMFKIAPVTYVIAADKRWLTTIYEDKYDKFSKAVSEPAKPLGILFMDKTFQLVLTLPEIPPAIRKSYWDYLLNLGHQTMKEKMDDASKTAASLVNKANDSNQDLMKLAKEPRQDDPIIAQKVREEVIKKLSMPDQDKKTEHFLQQFIHLLEPNPRAMKRLLNAYSVEQSVAILSNMDLSENEIALWTILKLRFPVLADFLLENPEVIEHFQNDKIKAGTKLVENETINRFFFNAEIRSVCKGTNEVQLSKDMISRVLFQDKIVQ